MAVSVDEVFDQIVEESVDKRQQGTRWERAVQWFLTQDPAWRDRGDSGEMLFKDAVRHGRVHGLHGVDGRHTIQAFHHRGHRARGEP